ncbi:MAG: YggS family pyridoxal phosphate-dependent enzyme [Buchnera aphidicola (Brevicoryne brassicae)]|uniref:Pyridoxal phosphate homeostasis protein n=1 Tax=Buchnera aphidicola (Brevicoryne brassicae) TaxID=911343 RepID=A0AAJ5TXK9_9GAMM|nr:YggS family pyridoxal phosphate-dependent enzyme [Buchnera aphidicola]WAI19248.1 MAG: YggS family pyridoxal phosphate-dependent enzyme [Buchnera aphidicola (Brevicoryne brassicae)]
MTVTKNQNIDIIEQSILLGIKEFGENYAKEGVCKIQKLQKYKNIIWHFIGKIQSNKTKIVAQNFDWCQTINTEKIALLLNQYRPKNLLPINVLIQINVSKEPNKNGININEYQKLAKVISLMPNLNLRGIMAMPEIKKNIIDNNIQYKKIKIIFNQLKRKYASVDTLSLGTSFDIKKSLLAESNMIRIGRNIFNK